MAALSRKNNDCGGSDDGLSISGVGADGTQAAIVATDDCEDENANASFLDNNHHLKRPIQQSSAIHWSPCRLVTNLLIVFFLTGLAISVVLFLDQRHQQSTPLILRFHPQTPLPSSRLDTPTSQSQQPQPSNWTFCIMQITDIHLGEDENTDWGPEQDVKTFSLLDKLFTYESPDLIVLGGDQLTANNCLHNCTEYYRILGRYLTMQGIPWTTVLGNHDDMAFEPQHDAKKETIPHPYTRRELLAVDESFRLSLTQTGPEDVTGASNYVLNVMAPDQNSNEPVVQLFFLDSGGGALPEAIDDSQVQWFRQEASLRQDLPAVAFQHIPASGHVYDIDTCTGFRGQGVEQIQDAGLVDAMVESGHFHFLAVGHNHGNDYCCPRHKSDDNIDNNGNAIKDHDLYFCFGRHSGYGGYGNWQRGVRMYELMLSPNKDDVLDREEQAARESKREFRWRTWVRLESGAYVDFLDYDHQFESIR